MSYFYAATLKYLLFAMAYVAVDTAQENTEKITTSGVLLGDTLEPFLISTLLDYVLRETLLNNIDGFTIIRRISSCYPAVRIGALVYENDIAITCDTIDQFENVLQRLEVHA